MIQLEPIRAAASDFEARRLLLRSGRHRSLLGPRKRLRLTRFFSPLEVGFDSDGRVAPHPGDAGGDGAVHQSSVDAADVD